MLETSKNPHEIDVTIDNKTVQNHMYKRNMGYYDFANELGIQPSHLHKLIKHNIGGGKLIWGKLYYYCKKNELNFESFLKQEDVYK
jgi:hypothetical protein